MSEKQRLTTEQIEQNNKNINKIKEITANLKAISENLNGNAIKGAYENSIKNLEKKNETYYKDIFLVTDSEKELLRKIRAGEIKTLSDETSDTDGDNPPVSEENVESTGKGKRKH